jgi:outer membrane lipoprotein carrier protein
MTLSKYAFGGTLLIALSSPALAVDKAKVDTKPQLSLAKLQSTYKQAGSVEADFTQEVYQASLARTKTSKGSLKLSKPGLVRWEIAEPEASVMVSDGRKVSYFTPDARGKGKGQVIERKAAELERQPIFRILTGSAPLDKEFEVQKQEQVPGVLPEAKVFQVSLKPKGAMGDLSLAKIRVNSKYLIEELILENVNGNTTKITLQNQALGAKLPGALFQFKAPPGTEVVKN